ncbi:MAG: hypothetical protein ACSLE1_03340 [Sphingobium sp.]
MKKSSVTGVAGAARIDNLSMAELTYAEFHGKRLDKTGQARAINNEPPLTTTGLDLNALYKRHIAGAFLPKSRAKVMQVVIQFPKDLVDGEDAGLMLQHARAFTESVFGPDSIFADRVDRDEAGRHLVDLFIAPKYMKKTKHEEKLAVTMSIHQKQLAQKYKCPPNPAGTGRALQDALFEYLRDTMGLTGVKRGEPKLIPGPDWKASEQLRSDELDDLSAQADARERELNAREKQAEAMRAELEQRRADVTQREEGSEAARKDAEQIARRADDDRRFAEAQRVEVQRWRDEQEQEIARQHRELVEAQKAVIAERSAVEHQRRRLETSYAAAAEARQRAAADAEAASRLRSTAASISADAAREKETAEAARRELTDQRAIHMAQLALLARAADSENGLDLRVGEKTFTMRTVKMTDFERAANNKPWAPALVTIARILAIALQRLRDAAGRIVLRETAVADREASALAKEVQLQRDRADHDARRREHANAIAGLDRRQVEVEAAEERASVSAIAAAAAMADAAVRQREADAALADNRRWMVIMDRLEANPEWVDVGAGGRLLLDSSLAARSPDLARAFSEKPPKWVESLAVQRLELHEKMLAAEQKERIAVHAAERLTDMVEAVGPVLTPVQRDTVQQVSNIASHFDPRLRGPER